MVKQAFVSISDLAWDAAGNPDFEKLKEGYTGELSDGRKYVITRGVPKTAKLDQVIYLYSDDSLPEVDNPLEQASTYISSEYYKSEKE